MSRQLSRFVARWMLGVLLMGHWAVAAYVCPSLLNQASVAEQRSAAAAQLPGDAVSKAACDHALGASDPAQPNLCKSFRLKSRCAQRNMLPFMLVRLMRMVLLLKKSKM